jgi:hypothetical protein
MNTATLTKREVVLQEAYDQGYRHYPTSANGWEAYSDEWKAYVRGFNNARYDQCAYWDDSWRL